MLIRSIVASLLLGTMLAGAAAAQWQGSAALGIEVADDDGHPIAGASVVLRFGEPQIGPPPALTDAAGRLSASGLAEGEWYVEISHDGYMLYAAYVKLRAGKKPVVAFSSQVNTATSWSPMRVKFSKSAAAFGPAPPVEQRAEAADRERARQAAPPQPAPPRAESAQAARRPAPPAETPPETPAPAPVPSPATPRSESAEAARRPAPAAAEPPAETPQPAPPTPAPPAPVTARQPEPGTEPVAAPVSAEAVTERALATPPPPAVEPPVEEAELPAVEPPVEEAELTSAQAAVEEAMVPPVPAPVEEPAAPAAEPEVALPEPPVAEPRLATPPPPRTEPVTTPAPEIAPPAVSPPQPAERPAPAPQAELPAPPLPGRPTPLPEIPAAPSRAEVPAPAPAEPRAEPAGSLPQPGAPAPTVPEPPAGAAVAMPAYLSSFASGDCPGCKAGEWAVTAQEMVPEAGALAAAPACPTDLAPVDEAARVLGAAGGERLSAFAGPLFLAMIGGQSGMVGPDARRQARALLVPLIDPTSSCRLVAVVLPRGATFLGYQYEAWDTLGGGGCLADRECPMGQARWAGEPRIADTGAGSVVYALFQNRSSRRERRAKLTVYFTPPGPDWRP